MSERMIIDALPVRNNILLGIVATNTGNAVVDAMIQGALRACLEELDDAPKVEVQEWRRASDPPPTHNETWNDGNETYSGETSMKVWAHCADGTQHEAHYEIHDGTGQWFVEGQDDRFDEHGNVTHWMYYPAAPKDQLPENGKKHNLKGRKSSLGSLYTRYFCDCAGPQKKNKHRKLTGAGGDRDAQKLYQRKKDYLW